MESLVDQISTLMGIDPTTVGMVLAGLLDIASQTLGPDAGASLIGSIPGAPDLLANNFMGLGLSFSSLLDQSPDAAKALLDLVQDSGLAPDQVASIADQLFDYVRQTTGNDAASQLMSGLPGIGGLG